MSLTASEKQSYWERVQGALEIAGAPADLADNLLHKVESLPEQQRELFYHAEPLDVAKDLSGVERWSDEQVSSYIEQSRLITNPHDELPISPQIAITKYDIQELPSTTVSELKHGHFQRQALFRIIGKMEAEKEYTQKGLLLAEIVGIAGLIASIALAVIGLISVIPAIFFSALTAIITLLLFPASIKLSFGSVRDEKTVRKNSK